LQPRPKQIEKPSPGTAPTDAAGLTEALRNAARRLGFGLVGVCPAVEPAGFPRFLEWLEAGFGGEMRYLDERRAAYAHPRHVLDGVRSLVVLGHSYRTAEPAPTQPGQGRVARYAWGTDYHDVLHERMHELADYLRELRPEAKVRGVVDSAPLLEREFAQLAGLGWIGKNTLVLNRELGSWFFLCVLLTDAELAYDTGRETDHCGTCTACLDACPTQAFVAPYVLDARRCISYTTIELREEIPQGLRAGHGDWVFGCDVCQDVCPWNRKAPAVEEAEFAPRDGMNTLDLIELFELDDEAFRRRFRRTPLWRAKRRGILRNAAIVLGNQHYAGAVAALSKGADDEEPLVRDACRWALEQIQSG
jgi:epoxyqueuosine reductase